MRPKTFMSTVDDVDVELGLWISKNPNAEIKHLAQSSLRAEHKHGGVRTFVITTILYDGKSSGDDVLVNA